MSARIRKDKWNRVSIIYTENTLRDVMHQVWWYVFDRTQGRANPFSPVIESIKEFRRGL